MKPTYLWAFVRNGKLASPALRETRRETFETYVPNATAETWKQMQKDGYRIIKVKVSAA